MAKIPQDWNSTVGEPAPARAVSRVGCIERHPIHKQPVSIPACGFPYRRFDRVNLRPLIKRLRALNQFEFTSINSNFWLACRIIPSQPWGDLHMRIERYTRLSAYPYATVGFFTV